MKDNKKRESDIPASGIIRRFKIKFTFYHEPVDYAIIELDQVCFDVVDDDWRAGLYNLHTDEEIAQHIGANHFLNSIRLTQMDGWANLDDLFLKVIKYPTLDDFDVEATEIVQ